MPVFSFLSFLSSNLIKYTTSTIWPRFLSSSAALNKHTTSTIWPRFLFSSAAVSRAEPSHSDRCGPKGITSGTETGNETRPETRTDTNTDEDAARQPSAAPPVGARPAWHPPCSSTLRGGPREGSCQGWMCSWPHSTS